MKYNSVSTSFHPLIKLFSYSKDSSVGFDQCKKFHSYDSFTEIPVNDFDWL